MQLSVTEIVNRVVETGLVPRNDIKAAAQSAVAKADRTALGLAKALVKQKLLTKYQLQQIVDGKGDSLTLGNYVVLDKIGQGGMGMVLKAKHKRMKRRVALKILSPALTETPDLLNRFQREIEAAAALEHPNVVTAYDADESNGTHFLVMQYVDGVDLASHVQANGPFSIANALQCIVQAGRGLQYAHEHGIVHRDIKPANLLLDKKGIVQILDMGLARLVSATPQDDQLTATGQIMGTVDYLAPEQAMNTKTADARADIYSLGVTLWYLLTAEPAYTGETVVEKLLAHQQKPIPSLCEARPEASPELEAVFQKMLAKNPEERYQTMSEMLIELEACHPALAESVTSSGVALSSPGVNLDSGNLTEGFPDKTVLANPPSVASTSYANPTVDLSDAQVGTDPQTQKSLVAPQPLAKRSNNRSSFLSIGWIAGIAAGILGLVVLLAMAGIFLRVETNVGTIVLEIDQPELAGATVSIDDQKKITLKTGEGKEPIEITADEKTHTLKVTKGGFETLTKQFSVKAGKQEAIRVRLEAKVMTTNVDQGNGPPLAIAPFDADQAKQYQQAWAEYLGVPAAYTNSTGIKFVLIPPGEFVMGSPDEEHGPQVDETRMKRAIPQAFYLGRHEVTVGQFRKFVEATGYETEAEKDATRGRKFGASGSANWRSPGFSQTDESPLTLVVLKDINAYCHWLSDKETGTVQLPDEAQWEYACRAGTTTATAFGDRLDSTQANFNGSKPYNGAATGEYKKQPVRVGSYQPNAWGLYDMHGNVWEKCEPGLLLRGAGWPEYGRTCRSARRYTSSTEVCYNHVGFRVILTINSERQPPALRIPKLNFVKSMAPIPDFTPEAARDGDALLFDGVDDYVQLPFGYTEDQPITIEAWVRLGNHAVNTMQYVISDVEVGGTGLRVDPGIYRGQLSITNESDGARYLEVTAPFERSEKFVHLAFVVDAAEARLFIDGKLAGRENRQGNVLNASSRNFCIGAQPDGQESDVRDFLHGKIDEVRFSTVARYTKEFSPPKRHVTDEDTLALYHFDEGQGDVLTDSSGNGHHGKIFSASWANSKQPASKPGGKLSSSALVQSPTPLPDVLSWTVQTKRHSAPVRRVQFSPDGTMLATSSPDSTVRLWDAKSKALLRILPTGDAHGSTLEFSPGGKYLASYDNYDAVTVCVWEVATGRLVHRFAHGEVTFKKIAWNPRQPQLATSSETEIVVWNLVSGVKQFAFNKHHDTIEYLRWSADGGRLASISQSDAMFWDTSTGVGVGQIAPDAPMIQKAVSPDGNLLVTGGGNDRVPLELWDLAEGDKQTLSPYSGGISAITFSRDGAEIAYVRGTENIIVRQSAADGKVLAELETSSKIDWMDYAPDGNTLVTAGEKVETWNLKTGDTSLLFAPPSASIANLLWPSEGSEIGVSDGAGTLWKLELTSNPSLRQQEYPQTNVYAFRDGKYHYTRDSGTSLRVYDGDSGEIIKTLTDVGNWSLSPDSRLLAVRPYDVANQVRIQEFPSGKLLRTLEFDPPTGVSMQFSPDGKKLAVSLNDHGVGRVDIWNVATGDRIQSIKDSLGTTMGAVDWSPDGETIAVRRFWGSSIYDSNTGKALFFLHYGPGGAASSHGYIRFCGDGQTVFVKEHDRFLFYNLRDKGTKNEKGEFGPYQTRVLARGWWLAWSADNSILAIPNSRKFVLFYDWSNDRELGTLSIVTDEDKSAAIFTDRSGHYQVVGEMSDEMVYTVLKTDGTQQTLTAAEFETKYQWKNDPTKVQLIDTIINTFPEVSGSKQVESPPKP